MKKRIISLILVVATLLVTLTGCGFNYAKADLAAYATLSNDFKTALTSGAISFTDGDFGTDEATRWEKVEDALAAALLKLADAEDTKYAGNPAKYDNVSYRYFAVTEDGKVLMVSNMDPSKSTSIQLGLTSHKDFNKALSDAFLNVDGDLGAFYTTSSQVLVADKDVVSITYKDAEGKTHEYQTVTISSLEYSELIGKKVGDTVETVTVKKTTGEGESAVTETTATYTEVKVNSIIKDASTSATTKANDLIFVTYTATIEYTPDEGSTVQSIKVGDYEYKLDSTGKYTYTVTSAPLLLGEADGTGTDAVKTFKGQLVGKSTGSVTIPSTTEIKENVKVTLKTGDEETTSDVEVAVKYSSVKINWIVNEGFGIDAEGNYVGGVSFDYTAVADSTEKDILGNSVKIEKDKTTLTYYAFPVSFVETPEFDVAVDEKGSFTSVSGLDAEEIIRNYHSVLLTTKTDEHNETEEHDHDALVHYVLACVESNEYKNGEKTLADLLKELDTLLNSSSGTHTKNKTALDKAISALETAQKNLAKDTSEEGSSTKDNLKKKVETARTDYNKAKEDADKTEKKVDEKVKAILECKKGETSVASAICEDYTKYQYKTLEDAYKKAINDKVVTDILELVDKYLTCDLNKLPKSAVKEAKKSIINSYKYTFYTGTTSSTGSTGSSTSKTNYEVYGGDFDAYLIAAVKKDMGSSTDITLEKAYEYIDKTAKETVKDIIMIYVLADAFGLKLTKAEIKEHKNYYKKTEYQREIYAAYGLMSNYTVDEYLNAKQFDKVMDYFLEEGEVDATNANVVTYKNVKYTLESEEPEKE